jgi:glucans biosynthesis protein
VLGKTNVSEMLGDLQCANPLHGVTLNAKSKRTLNPCGAPSVRGHRVCRFHGAGGGAPKGNRNVWKHGNYSAESLELRRVFSALGREARELI